ncbi:MAG: gamma-glutamyltransferase [Acidimicrobiia bacterium]|nr:gamma-glutamyltransferase [Acidimicrobiia bacterium]
MTTDGPSRRDGTKLLSTGPDAVVTPHYLATRAGTAVLRKGGNAADAAIAANAVLGVVAPETCGIGGDLFALVHGRNMAEPAALNASGRAGSGARAELVRAEGLRSIPMRSRWAVTVPGCVDGWLALYERYGTLPFQELLEPAIGLARHGFEVSQELARSLTRLAGVLSQQPSGFNLYPSGIAPEPGDMLVREDLAGTLERIAADGREAFYSGAVGKAIAAATDGVLTDGDLATNQANWIRPLSLEVMGHTGWTIPPNSQGYMALAASWIFEQLDPPRDPADPGFTHAAIEAYRSVAWERDWLVADPDHCELPPDQLVEPSRLADRLERIEKSRRTTWPDPRPAPGGTAYLCVWDSSGLGVSLIQSNYHGIGSGIGVGTAGFFLHDRGSGFTLDPGHPNELAPGKRPLHTLSPTLWTKDKALSMLLGTRGGDYQPQTLLQMVTHLLWARVSPVQAQQLPRWVTGLNDTTGPTVSHEPMLSDTHRTELIRRGHNMEPTAGWISGWGPVSLTTASAGKVIGAADPRVATTHAATCSPAPQGELA